MIIRPIARQRGVLLSLSTSSRPIRPLSPFLIHQARFAHTVPSLDSQGNDFAGNGIGDLFSSQAYKVAWTDYQNFLVDRLNTILANDATRSNWDVKTILQNAAREPSMGPTFNYASMAHNNYFFFRTLSPKPTEIPKELSQNLINSFSSIDTLRSTFLTTAAAMFGPGFVWLVQTENPSSTHPAVSNSAGHGIHNNRSRLHFRIVATYLAGSPYPQAHTRQQGIDMNLQNLQSIQEYSKQSKVQNTAGSFGPYSAAGRGMADIGLADGDSGGDPRQFGGADILPVLCVNTWEHCYLNDFGVAGKRAYLEKWWDSVDWDRVWSHCFKKEQINFAR